MSDVKWIKLTTNMFDDEKIKLIEQMPEADTVLIIWIKLLAQAGKTNTSGYIFLSENIPYTEEMLSAIFNRPLNIVRLALKTLEQLGMIDIDENSFISIANWEKHQNVKGLEKIREQTRIRVAKHREKKALEQPKKNVTLHVTQGNETELELELEQEKERPSFPEEQEIFDYYISKNIIRHQKFDPDMKRAVKRALKKFGVDEVKTAIDNYSTVFHGNEYWFKQKYTLMNIMRDKDIRQFGSEADPLNNFLVDKARSFKESDRRSGVSPDQLEHQKIREEMLERMGNK